MTKPDDVPGLSPDHWAQVLVAQHVLGDEPSRENAMGLMILLHTYNIAFKDEPWGDYGVPRNFIDYTWRAAGSIMAAAWPDRTDEFRTDYVHWYYEFLKDGFEIVEDITPEWLPFVNRARQMLLDHPNVESVEPND